MKLAQFLFFSILWMTSCASTPGASKPSLSQLEKLDFHEIHLANAATKIGTPDVKGTHDKSGHEEAWIYLDDQRRTTRLSLIFNKKSGALRSAHWFIQENEPESDLSSLAKKYSVSESNLKSPTVVKKGLLGSGMLFYSSSKGPQKIAVDEKSGQVIALSWRFETDDFSTKDRRPTSH